MPPNTAKLLEFFRRFSGPTRPAHARLVVCGRCGRDFVNPVSWHELDETRWWIRLRCGECGVVREVEVTNEEARRFESQLDRGVRQIAASAARLDRARMIADADTLTAALARDLIDPSDFCR
jgi:ribosomal protein S27AE